MTVKSHGRLKAIGTYQFHTGSGAGLSGLPLREIPLQADRLFEKTKRTVCERPERPLPSKKDRLELDSAALIA